MLRVTSRSAARAIRGVAGLSSRDLESLRVVNTCRFSAEVASWRREYTLWTRSHPTGRRMQIRARTPSVNRPSRQPG